MFHVAIIQEDGRELEFQSAPNDTSRIIKFEFYYSPTPNTVFTMIAVLKGRNLYMEIQTAQHAGFSKEAFVASLEYAEDVLRCENVIVYFPKDSSERAAWIRNFMFMGFAVIPPGNQLALQLQPENIYMVSKIK